MKCCKDCQHFRDGHYSRVYITPRCTVLGDDAASYMRKHVCGIDEPRHWQPKTTAEAQAPEATTHAGARPEKAI